MRSSFRSWTLRGPSFDLVISRPGLSDAPAKTPEEPAMLVMHHLDRWLSSASASTLFEIYGSLGGSEPTGHTVLQREDYLMRLRRRVAEALQTGELIAVIQRRRELVGFVLHEQASPSPPRPAPAPEPERTFIGIRLVDEQGTPVPNQRYSITLPNGARRTGTTNFRGEAREDYVPQGECKVSFPDLDADSWS